MRARGTDAVYAGASSMSGHTSNAPKRSDKPAPPTQRTIAEIDKFWRDRSGRAIVTRLTEYGGHSLVDVRTFYTAADGTMRPAKGLACSVRLLPQLARSIAKAIGKARELGLLADAEAGNQ